MIKTPKVTVIMATYNRANYIYETLLSIQSQIFTNWECLIIDDGGTDNTEIIIAPMLHNDKRFQFLKRPESYKKGLPGCRNYGLDLAQGDYVIFFDDDDIAHPQNLELCVLELSKNEVSFCRYIRDVFFNDFHYKFDFSSNYTSFLITAKDIASILRFELPFNSCAIMWKKECFEENRFVEHLMYAEEWELYPRILSNGFEGVSIEKTLFYGRKHQDSNTGEFYNNDPIRRASYAEAILLVVQNLKAKQMLTKPIIRYFVQVSRDYKNFNLLKNIELILGFTAVKSLELRLFYFILPLRLFFYKKKKQIKNIFQ
jgi:glycosyltransferase involved in cell wall biosynthesis